MESFTYSSIDLFRDHRKLFVGDARGRVFTWSVADSQGTGERVHELLYHVFALVRLSLLIPV